MFVNVFFCFMLVFFFVFLSLGAAGPGRDAGQGRDFYFLGFPEKCESLCGDLTILAYCT